MKNAITKVFILFLSISSLSAQVQEETPFRFGIHLSPNFSYISSDDPGVSNAVRLKFGFGLMAEYSFASNYALATGINVVQRGGILTVASDNLEPTGPREGDYNGSFLQVPISLKMRTRQFGFMTYFADFGGSLDFEMNEKVSFEPAFPDGGELDSYVRFLNFMFKFGAGAEYSLGGRSALTAGIYYNRSLIDNLDSDIPGINKSYNYRFDYISLNLGVLF